MIEKDFYGKYQYDETVEPETNSGAEKKVSVSIHQKNPQVSINTGWDYFIPYNNLGIYGKIGGPIISIRIINIKTYYSDKKLY